MATTFYTARARTTPFTFAVSATWQESAALIRRQAVTLYDGSVPTSSNAVVVTSTATTPELHVCGQFVSAPVAAQTISGTCTAQFLCRESNANFNGTLQLGIRVISDAGTVRGTLLAVGGSVGTATPPEFATSFTNRQLLATAASSNPLALTSVAATAGDRIVFEVGVRDVDSGTARLGEVIFGASSSATDLPADNTTTAGNPWIQLSGTITFMDLQRPTFPDGVQFMQRTGAIASGVMPPWNEPR